MSDSVTSNGKDKDRSSSSGHSDNTSRQRVSLSVQQSNNRQMPNDQRPQDGRCTRDDWQCYSTPVASTVQSAKGTSRQNEKMLSQICFPKSSMPIEHSARASVVSSQSELAASPNLSLLFANSVRLSSADSSSLGLCSSMHSESNYLSFDKWGKEREFFSTKYHYWQRLLSNAFFDVTDVPIVKRLLQQIHWLMDYCCDNIKVKQPVSEEVYKARKEEMLFNEQSLKKKIPSSPHSNGKKRPFQSAEQIESVNGCESLKRSKSGKVSESVEVSGPLNLSKPVKESVKVSGPLNLSKPVKEIRILQCSEAEAYDVMPVLSPQLDQSASSASDHQLVNEDMPAKAVLETASCSPTQKKTQVVLPNLRSMIPSDAKKPPIMANSCRSIICSAFNAKQQQKDSHGIHNQIQRESNCSSNHPTNGAMIAELPADTQNISTDRSPGVNPIKIDPRAFTLINSSRIGTALVIATLLRRWKFVLEKLVEHSATAALQTRLTSYVVELKNALSYPNRYSSDYCDLLIRKNSIFKKNLLENGMQKLARHWLLFENNRSTLLSNSLKEIEHRVLTSSAQSSERNNELVQKVAQTDEVKVLLKVRDYLSDDANTLAVSRRKNERTKLQSEGCMSSPPKMSQEASHTFRFMPTSVNQFLPSNQMTSSRVVSEKDRSISNQFAVSHIPSGQARNRIMGGLDLRKRSSVNTSVDLVSPTNKKQKLDSNLKQDTNQLTSAAVLSFSNRPKRNVKAPDRFLFEDEIEEGKGVDKIAMVVPPSKKSTLDALSQATIKSNFKPSSSSRSSDGVEHSKCAGNSLMIIKKSQSLPSTDIKSIVSIEEIVNLRCNHVGVVHEEKNYEATLQNGTRIDITRDTFRKWKRFNGRVVNSVESLESKGAKKSKENRKESDKICGSEPISQSQKNMSKHIAKSPRLSKFKDILKNSVGNETGSCSIVEPVEPFSSDMLQDLTVKRDGRIAQSQGVSNGISNINGATSSGITASVKTTAA